MKLPIKCPICNDPLLNEDVYLSKMWRKICANKLNHKFFVIYEVNTDMIVNFSIVDDKNNAWRFYPLDDTIAIYKDVKLQLLKNLRRDGSLKNYKIIPYFEPDFSDFKKLINKLRTYTLFL